MMIAQEKTYVRYVHKTYNNFSTKVYKYTHTHTYILLLSMTIVFLLDPRELLCGGIVGRRASISFAVTRHFNLWLFA